VSLAAGALLTFLGLLAWLVGAHFKSRRYFDRPALARNPYFDPFVAFLHWTLLAVGLVALSLASMTVGAAAAAILVIGWAYRRVIRSVPFRRRLMRRDFESLQKSRPDLSEQEILFRLVLERHPRWGEELIEQMVLDYPSVDRLAPMIAKMERGFRGFR
jgi:hypothetical protein